ncbi:MAG: ATP-binding protein, partial [Promethearchaeota archaeon]
FKGNMFPSFAWKKIDDDLILIDYNLAAENFTKGHIRKLIGKTPKEIYKNNPKICEDLYRCLKDRCNISREAKISYEFFESENDIHIMYNFIPPDFILVQKQDITERKKTEKKLKESEQQLRKLNKALEQEIKERTKELKELKEKYHLISENARDLITILNNKYEYEYINEQAYLNILGYNNDDLIGKSAFDLLHPEDQEYMINTYQISKDGFQGLQGEGHDELRIRAKNGQYVWIETLSRVFINSEGKSKVMIIGRDITKRKKKEVKLSRSEKKYHDAYYVSNVYKDLLAHDINNILQVINSSSEFISIYLKDPQKVHKINKLVKNINDQIVRGKQLISNVRRLSQLEKLTSRLNAIRVHEFLKEAIEFIIKSYPKREININVEIHDKNHFIIANEFLKDVFENILLNAVKHNVNQTVKILVRISKKKYNRLKYVKMEFLDNGIGIPDNKKELIFRRVEKEIKRGNGMGLGLSLVKIIIDSYKGKIWVEDKVKGDFTKGSNFIILFPIANS